MIEIEEEYENIAKSFCVKKQDVINAIQQQPKIGEKSDLIRMHVDRILSNPVKKEEVEFIILECEEISKMKTHSIVNVFIDSYEKESSVEPIIELESKYFMNLDNETYVPNFAGGTWERDCRNRESAKKIRTYKDACKIMDKYPADISPFQKLEIIVSALNILSCPYNMTIDTKWIPVFSKTGKFKETVNVRIYPGLNKHQFPENLFLKNEIHADHIGRQFEYLYKSYLETGKLSF
jgi:hypothetical protein